MKDISMRKMAQDANTNVAFIHDTGDLIKVEVKFYGGRSETFSPTLNTPTVLGTKNSIFEIKIYANSATYEPPYVFSAQDIASALVYESGLNQYSLHFSRLLATNQGRQSEPSSLFVDRLNQSDVSIPDPLSPKIDPPSGNFFPTSPPLFVGPMPSDSSLLNYDRGTTLTDSAGNKYVINGPLSFTYIPKVGTPKTITNKSKFKEGTQYGWDKAVNIINNLAKENSVRKRNASKRDISIRKTAGYGGDISNTYDLIIKNDTDFTCNLYIGKYRAGGKQVSLNPGQSDINHAKDTLVKEISADNNNNKSKVLSDLGEVSKLAKWEGESYSLYISDLLGEEKSNGGARTSTPSGTGVTPQRGGGKNSSGQGVKIQLAHPEKTVLHDSSYTYTVNSPTSFSFTNNSSGKSGSMNSSQSSWNAAATALNALKPSETTTDAAAPTATGASTPTASAATSAPAEAATTAPAAETVDDAKVKDVLKSIFDAVLNKTLKIDISGIDFRAESKVWRGVIRGLGGADGAASKVLAEAGLNDAQKLAIQSVSANNLSSISKKPYLSKIHNYLYGLKKKYVKSFAGMTVASEDQIAKAVNKGLTGAGSTAKTSEKLQALHTLSKVAARRERAKKSLDSAIEKEASVEDDMTSKVEKRRAAARAKLGL